MQGKLESIDNNMATESPMQRSGFGADLLV